MKTNQGVLKLNYKALSRIERQFYRELISKFFNPRGQMIKKFINSFKNIEELKENLHKLDIILKKFTNTYHIIGLKYWLKSFNIIKNTNLMVKNSLNFTELFKERTNIEEIDIFKRDEDLAVRIMKKMFIASQKTLLRVDSQIMDIIGASIYKGVGINEVANNLMTKYNSLKVFEAKRIARTETHVVMNTTTFEEYKSSGVEKVQWLSTNDERTRPSHQELDGEVVKLGEPFSNGLLHPCDTNGDIEEWINCRCALLSIYEK